MQKTGQISRDTFQITAYVLKKKKKKKKKEKKKKTYFHAQVDVHK